MQPGDVPQTFANIDSIESIANYRPSTLLNTGIGNFVDWYKKYAKP
jgi:UDP-glucuronate 4-epimerase